MFDYLIPPTGKLLFTEGIVREQFLALLVWAFYKGLVDVSVV